MVPAITAITATAGPIAGATKRASDPNAVGSDRQPSRSLHDHARETSSPKIANTPDRHGRIRVLQTKGELIRSFARRVRSQLLPLRTPGRSDRRPRSSRRRLRHPRTQFTSQYLHGLSMISFSDCLDVERAQVFLMRLSAKIPNGLV